MQTGSNNNNTNDIVLRWTKFLSISAIKYIIIYNFLYNMYRKSTIPRYCIFRIKGEKIT